MESLSIKHRRYFAPQSWQAVSGILEVQSISAQINGRLSIDSFQWFVKIIKYWSIQRCIKGNAWGFLSSYSWTILAAWVIQQIPDNEEVEDLMVLITYFFDVLVSYNWAIPLSLIDEHNYKSRGKQDRMAILTSVKPYYNSARNVTQSTAKLLKKEFKRGQEIMGKLSHGKANWEDLLEKVTLPSSPNLTLIVSSSTAEELQEACGWLEGHIVGLIISLEQLEQLIVRPYPSIKRDKKTVWFYIDLQGIKKELFPVIKSCIATFIHSFEFDNQASELSYKLH